MPGTTDRLWADRRTSGPQQKSWDSYRSTIPLLRIRPDQYCFGSCGHHRGRIWGAGGQRLAAAELAPSSSFSFVYFEIFGTSHLAVRRFRRGRCQVAGPSLPWVRGHPHPPEGRRALLFSYLRLFKRVFNVRYNDVGDFIAESLTNRGEFHTVLFQTQPTTFHW